MNQPTAVTFEEGFNRLQTIATRLSEDTVPVAETCDLFAESKGLEQALTTYLNQQRARIEAIERGEGIVEFKITDVVEHPNHG